MQVKLKLASDPEVRVEPNKQPGIYLLLIQLCYQDEEYDQALEYCHKALEKYPTDKDIFLLEGQIQYQKGDMDKFLENLLNAEKVFEGDAEIFYNIGFVYGRKGENGKNPSSITRKPSRPIPSMSMLMSTWLPPCWMTNSGSMRRSTSCLCISMPSRRNSTMIS